MDHMVKAIDEALTQHTDIERSIDKFTDALSTSVYATLIGTMEQRGLDFSEGMKARMAFMAQELAHQYVDVSLPALLTKTAKGAAIPRDVYASALTQDLLIILTKQAAGVAERTLVPELVRRQKAAADAIPRAPMGGSSDAGPSMGIDLGGFARQAAHIHAVHEQAAALEHRKQHVIDGAVEGFTETNVMSAEAALAQQYPAHERGPAPSPERVLNALAKADTVAALAPVPSKSEGKYPASGKRR